MTFTEDKIVQDWLYLLHPTGYHTSHNLRNARLSYGGKEFETTYKGKLSYHDLMLWRNERKCDSVSYKKSYKQISSNSV